MNPYGGGTNQRSPTTDPVYHLERVTRAQLSLEIPGRAQQTFLVGNMELGVWKIQTEELIISGLMFIYRGMFIYEIIIIRNASDIANQAKSKVVFLNRELHSTSFLLSAYPHLPFA